MDVRVIVRRQQAGVNPRRNAPVTKLTNTPDRHQYYGRIIPLNADATKGLVQGPREMTHTHTHMHHLHWTHTAQRTQTETAGRLAWRLSAWPCGTRILPCRCGGVTCDQTCERIQASPRHSREAPRYTTTTMTFPAPA
ncbi:hypothetical protein CGRA01v4_12582 [Colletotrichum graminicola]|nr:hypothetical protein CGRA01v4_12582 [Colletotrichum graminicola]